MEISRINSEVGKNKKNSQNFQVRKKIELGWLLNTSWTLENDHSGRGVYATAHAMTKLIVGSPRAVMSNKQTLSIEKYIYIFI